MSLENVALHRRFVEAFNRRDIDSLIAFCDPGIEFHSAFAAVGGAVYHGHDELRRWHGDLQDVWGEELDVEVEAYFDLGEDVLAFYILHGRGRHSGVEVAMPNALLATWRDGLIVYFRVYAHREDALSDLGVSEDDLEPIAP
jgi:ketosteroid isomerase-like protein